MEAILPCYMQQIQSPSYIQSESKTEREIILQLAVAVRTMVHNSEGLAKLVNTITSSTHIFKESIENKKEYHLQEL